ncbi:hypothetical protein [Glaciecola sp. SC05]|uniref:hypothetical protein n=1 Tax=Glaciecola sp. SC05 TaxID=1987355 RepID=UPI0035281D98
MFNRSIKYILLLFLNIVVLFALYYNQEPAESGVFDTQFVISLLEERDELQSAVIDAEMGDMQYQEQITALESDIKELTASQQNINSEFMRCETNRASAESLAREQAAQLEIITNSVVSPANCDAQIAKVRLARQELANTQVQLQQQKDMVIELEARSVQSPIETAPSPDLLRTIEELEAQVSQLKADIENPIYLKTVYISGRKCEKPQFDELVCIQELLVRPQFSKAPTSDVTVTVYSPNNRVLASASFNSKRAQLFRFPLGRGKEVLAGDFSATFEVEDQLLRSDGHTITQ